MGRRGNHLDTVGGAAPVRPLGLSFFLSFFLCILLCEKAWELDSLLGGWVILLVVELRSWSLFLLDFPFCISKERLFLKNYIQNLLTPIYLGT